MREVWGVYGNNKMVNSSQGLAKAPWVRNTKILLVAGVEPGVSAHKDTNSVLRTKKVGQGTGRRRKQQEERDIKR